MEHQLEWASVSLPREEAVDCQVKLLELVNQFINGKLKPAPHQRAFVWEKAKRQSYVQRYKDQNKPIGLFATYQLTNGDDLTVYLNDGRQRLSTLEESLKNPTLYGYSRKEDVETLLSAPRVTQQHRHYPNHMEAMKDFQDHNKGTALTAGEYYYGYLSNLPGWDRVWKGRYDKILQCVRDGLIRLSSKPATSRITLHKMNRHSLSLFHRFISGEKGMYIYPVAAAGYSSKISYQLSIEYLLSLYFQASPSDKADRDITLFDGLIKREVALLHQIFREDLREKSSFNETVARWLLDVAILCKNNEIPATPRVEFLKKFLRHSRGKVVFPNFTNGTLNATVGLARLKDVDRYSMALGCDLFDEKWKRRKRSTANVPAGMDISHIEPFALYGEGETVLEPAIRNRSRGAKAME